MSGRCVGCPNGLTMCNGACVNLDMDNQNCGACGTACGAGLMCRSGVCSCKDGQALCGLLCIGIMSDRTNCGGCGILCLLGQKCDKGSCVSD
jgi:hypothetical protein